MPAKNSFATVAEQVINYNNNILNLLSSLNSLMDSNESDVSIDYTDENRVLTTFNVPSWGYLTSEINRMNNNINSLFSINESGAIIETSENIFKKIILVDLNKEPSNIGSLNSIIKFNSRKNHFFDNLLNPNLSIEIDLYDKIDENINKIKVRRYILEFEKNIDNTLTQDGIFALNSYNSKFRNKSNISIDEYLDWMSKTPGVLNSDDPYYDEEYFNIKPNQLLYSGVFSILNIEEDIINKKLWYHLNTLEYTENINDNSKSIELIVGDNIIINREKTSTIYQISEISKSSSNPRIRLERIQGVEAIPVGVDTIKIYSPLWNDRKINVTVGYNERNIIFIKPIESVNNIISNNWSLGTSFFTNDLILDSDNSDNGKTMEQFYNEKVDDYGSIIKDLTKSKIPVSFAETPIAPILLTDNFKIVQINKHLTDSKDKKVISEKYKRMKELKSEVVQLDNTIIDKKTELRLSTFGTLDSKRSINKEIDTLISKKESSSKLLNSLTNDIITLSSSPSANNQVSPKYRVRGFWEIPSAINSNNSRPQEIVQFKVQYKYISLTDDTTQVETFKIKSDNDKKVTNAAFSNWNQFLTDSRKRVYNNEENLWMWEIEDISDADTPNINQIDIPIQSNEKVEIRVKSLSEVGFPEHPIESEWSDPIILEFPEDLSTIISGDNFILEEASREDMIVQIKGELGDIDGHLKDSIMVGEYEYYHSSDKILSMIPDKNGNHQSLLSYLRYLTDRISSLEDQINKTRGMLEVYVYRKDEEFLVQNDNTLHFNVECEDYLDKYDSEDGIVGRVYRNNIYIIKDFYIKIVNSSTTSPLGLLSNRLYNDDKTIYTNTSPQIFWVNDRDELLFNTSSGITNNQLNNQFIWSVNFDNADSRNNKSNNSGKLSENIGNNFTSVNSNSITSILSSTEYNIGYNENSILEFISNNNSLLDVKKWVDSSPTVKSANKLLTSIHPSIQNLEDLVENNSDKVKYFKPNQELLIPINIYFKMNAIDPADGSGKDNTYIDISNATSTTRHIKKLKFLIENESENKPFIFKLKFTINRNKVVVQKLGGDNKLTMVSKFKFKPYKNNL